MTRERLIRDWTRGMVVMIRSDLEPDLACNP